MQLKILKRAGWERCGIQPCESVADHTFGVALLTLFTAKSFDDKIDRQRCLAMALVHDLAESIVGDITPHDAVDRDEKRRREREAIDELSRELPDDELMQLWLEFEAGETREAKLVREMDVLEMAIQAKSYRSSGTLGSKHAFVFFDSARQRLNSDAGRKLLDEIIG